MTSQGHAYARFQRALRTGNMALIRAAAAELPRVGLADALEVCLVMRDSEPDRFQAAAVRWLGRYAAEHAETPGDVHDAAQAFCDLEDRPQLARDTLRELCSSTPALRP